MAKPDFLCVGAQKAGTTWLDKMFNGHKAIWTPPVKELQYFNELYMTNTFKWTKRHRLSHGEKAKSWAVKKGDQKRVDLCEHITMGKISTEWYEKVFDYAPKGTIKGEMTPEYSLLSEKHVKHIAEQYPDLKIIFVMREPLERALSGIKMRLKQQGFDQNSRQEDIDNFVVSCADNWDVIERGNYQKIIDVWQRSFKRSNMLLLFSDDLRQYPEASLVQVGKFLGVDTQGFKGDVHQKTHVGKSYIISDYAIEKVRKAQEKNTECYILLQESIFNASF
jgi:hypothetical protein